MRRKMLLKIYFTFLFVIITCEVAGFGGIVGGLSDGKDASGFVKSLVKQVESDEKLEGYGKLDVISYKTQIVSGTNYFVKVKPKASDEYLHLRIYLPLPNENSIPSLTAVQKNKSEYDEIEYFD